jgi:hypothetical protein
MLTLAPACLIRIVNEEINLLSADPGSYNAASWIPTSEIDLNKEIN